MALTYTWTINRLKKQNVPSVELNDVVVQAYWQCVGTNENNISGAFSNHTDFVLFSTENFTPFEDLTEAQVIGWVQDIVVGNLAYKDHIDECIQNQINSIVYPVTEVESDALPWAASTPE